MPQNGSLIGLVQQYCTQWCILPIKSQGSSLSVVSRALNPQTSKIAAMDPGALHVLVVDDVAMNRDFAAAFLTAAGHRVTCVEGGLEAIAIIQTTDFDVVLMDVRMPEMDGLEATRRIRKLAGTRGCVPIVALTARAFTEQVAECREAGMDSHVAKPFTPDTLLSAVLRAVRMEPADRKNLFRSQSVAGWSAPSHDATGSASHPVPVLGEKGANDHDKVSAMADDGATMCQNEARTLLDSIARVGATSFNITWTTYLSMSLSKHAWTTSGRPGVHISLEYTYWAGLERICQIENKFIDAFIADAWKRYPDYTADMAARVAVATYLYELSEPVAPAGSSSRSALPVSIRSLPGSDRLVLDQIAFDRTADFLPSEAIDTYVQIIADRAEALLSNLRVWDAFRRANELADAAHAIAGSAGMFGFNRLTHLGRCFEQAVDSGAADMPAVTEGLRAALCDTLSVIQDRKAALVVV